MSNITVSVCMITYGHQQYIREAIEGVLMQECTFKVDLIIANDCSPDDTDKVVEEILKTHNNASWINYIKQEQNIGMMPNFIFALNQCPGKYIAVCEGDDYWTDPLKLQKQVDFLEKNLDYNLCFHNTLSLHLDGTKKECNDWNQEQTFVLKDFTSSNFANTSSLLFRNNISPFPEWFANLAAGDWALILMNAEKGKIYYLPDIMSVYRIHDGGVWNSKSYGTMLLKGIELITAMDKAFEYKYHDYFKEGIKNRTKTLKNYEYANKKSIKKWMKNLIKPIIFGLIKFFSKSKDNL